MAFHFNWSPLIADTDRVRHMLTSSLNKSPKPPIIVDDIFVHELNLGSTPPSLEILEIGDLAEDRFRGIFKVRYQGDAYLTLQTRVQANPLHTFLSTRPDFASPSPLAAGSGLTIPLRITLSDFRMSGFVILVFNRQKGITLVFRNDPLESLKVSSTFDGIPFVREYLQKTIEAQLRVLFMEDLPVIIHRLSLRVFGSEEHSADNAEVERRLDAAYEDPIRRESADECSVVGLSAPGDDADFSQNNLLQLKALAESQCTLSLSTPSIRHAVYRASTNADRGDALHSARPRPPALSRIHTTPAFSRTGLSPTAPSAPPDVHLSHAGRPALVSHVSTSSASGSTYSLSSHSHSRARPRRRKNRVVDLRRNKDGAAADGYSDATSVSSGYTGSASRTDESTSFGSPTLTTIPSLSRSAQGHAPQEREGEVSTPESSPRKKKGRPAQPIHPSNSTAVDFAPGPPAPPLSTTAPYRPTRRPPTPLADAPDPDPTPRQSTYLTDTNAPRPAHLPRMQTLPTHPSLPSSFSRSASDLGTFDLAAAFKPRVRSPGPAAPAAAAAAAGDTHVSLGGGILEQAWLNKMTREIGLRVVEQERRGGWGARLEGEEEPPPAYGS